MNDLRRTFVHDQQDAAATEAGDIQLKIAHIMRSRTGPVPIPDRVTELLFKKLTDGLNLCEHIFATGPFDFPGMSFWLLGINSIVCRDCLTEAHLILDVVNSNSSECDLCGEIEPGNLFREFSVTLGHIIAIGCEGYSCCGVNNHQQGDR
jgi:hypothetical protein